ncbi:MAG: chloride channel protein [Pseudomonadota bacterium]
MDDQHLAVEVTGKKLPFHIWMWRQWFFFCVGAIAIGGVAVAFWAGSKFAHKFLRHVLEFSPLLPLVITPLGFALIVFITNKYFYAAQGSGVPQTLAALHAGESENPKKLLSLPIAAAKFVLTIAGQCVGGSIGREGPMVQIGASIMYTLGRFMPDGSTSRHQIDRALIAAGSAAGVAAAFNTPAAGVIFVIEQLLQSIERRVSSAMIATVVIATIVAEAGFHDYSYFGPVTTELPWSTGWPAILTCGIVGGLLGGIFIRAFRPVSTFLPAPVRHFRQSSPIKFAAACGLVVAILGVLSNGSIFGNGSAETRLLLENEHSLPFGYGLIKLAATFFSCLSGIPAGLFAPSLSVGAGIGAGVSAVMPSIPATAIILLGIAAYFAALFQAPITAFVIVMEMAGSYSMALPLMTAALIATAISRLICRRTLYDAMSERWRHWATSP